MRLLTVLNTALLFAAFGCGDDKDGGGCGPPPAKKEEASGGGGGSSGNKGGGGGQAQFITSDKRGRVPKPYRRKPDAEAPEKPAAAAGQTASASVPKAPAPAAPKKALKGPQIWRITQRNVDGISDRVEVSCRIMAAAADGQCSSAANYADIKERCCPGGRVERCKTSSSGVVLVGRGCGS